MHKLASWFSTEARLGWGKGRRQVSSNGQRTKASPELPCVLQLNSFPKTKQQLLIRVSEFLKKEQRLKCWTKTLESWPQASSLFLDSAAQNWPDQAAQVALIQSFEVVEFQSLGLIMMMPNNLYSIKPRSNRLWYIQKMIHVMQLNLSTQKYRDKYQANVKGWESAGLQHNNLAIWARKESVYYAQIVHKLGIMHDNYVFCA